MQTLVFALLVAAPSAPGETPDLPPERAVVLALRAYSWEPSVQEVCRAAVSYWRVRKLPFGAGRLRGSAALPALEVGALGGRLEDRTSRQQPGTPVRLVERNGLDWSWSVRARWRLDRLLFHPAELKVVSERIRMARIRDEIAQRVVRTYFFRRRLQILMRLRPARSVQTAMRRRLLLARATAELDVLTGGWFTRTIKERRSRSTLRGK